MGLWVFIVMELALYKFIIVLFLKYIWEYESSKEVKLDMYLFCLLTYFCLEISMGKICSKISQKYKIW